MADHEVCKYRSCVKSRAVRLNGRTHRFCEEHRRKALMYQRRYQGRVSLRREVLDDPAISCNSSAPPVAVVSSDPLLSCSEGKLQNREFDYVGDVKTTYELFSSSSMRLPAVELDGVVFEPLLSESMSEDIESIAGA